MKPFIAVNEPLLDGNEKKYLNECIDTGWISSEGPFIKTFEEKMAHLAGRRFGVAVANGSVALDMAIKALDISHGDEVILPTFTIISCAAAIVRMGAKPVLVDCDPKTWNMDVGQVEAKITKKTKAIMVVHIYGLPVDMDPILAIAQKYGLKIIEDAAEMHGQFYKDRPCGSFGDISTFSFYPNKHVTTGEGGMALTNDPVLAERLKSLRNLCFKPERRFVHDELGWNFRMTNLQAALGVAQVERIEKFIVKKREIGALYNRALSSLTNIELPVVETSYAKNIYWVFGLVLKEKVSFNAQQAMAMFAQKQIGTRPFFYPMHLQPVFLKMGLFTKESYPHAERIAERGFYLPSGLGLSLDQQKQVIETTKEILA